MYKKIYIDNDNKYTFFFIFLFVDIFFRIWIMLYVLDQQVDHQTENRTMKHILTVGQPFKKNSLSKFYKKYCSIKQNILVKFEENLLNLSYIQDENKFNNKYNKTM